MRLKAEGLALAGETLGLVWGFHLYNSNTRANLQNFTQSLENTELLIFSTIPHPQFSGAPAQGGTYLPCF